MPADMTDITKNPTINPINTAWTLVAAFLVFGMQAGFTMLEAGFCRSRETVNVLVECVFDTCFAASSTTHGATPSCSARATASSAGMIPTTPPPRATITGSSCKNITASHLYGTSGVPVLAHWVFQFAFADCASTICSGTMIGRTDFIGDILYSVCVSGFIYPIIGHWAWGPDGFLATMGWAGGTAAPSTNRFTHFLPHFGMNFHDFAGSTVVHSIGGWIAIGGRHHAWATDLVASSSVTAAAPCSRTTWSMGVIGGFILWFGWYGFNPGSSLSAMDFGGIGRIAANTTLAACTGGSGC